MSKLQMDIYLPQLEIDTDGKFVKKGDVVVTIDREDPKVAILDFGGSVGEVFLNARDLFAAMSKLDWSDDYE